MRGKRLFNLRAAAAFDEETGALEDSFARDFVDGHWGRTQPRERSASDDFYVRNHPRPEIGRAHV